MSHFFTNLWWCQHVQVLCGATSTREQVSPKYSHHDSAPMSTAFISTQEQYQQLFCLHCLLYQVIQYISEGKCQSFFWKEIDAVDLAHLETSETSGGFQQFPFGMYWITRWRRQCKKKSSWYCSWAEIKAGNMRVSSWWEKIMNDRCTKFWL